MPNAPSKFKLKTVLIGRAFLVVFCIWHFLAISLIQVSISTAFGDLHYRLFGKYLAFTGTWQRWGMFSSRPYIQTLEVSLRAYPSASESSSFQELGTVFPDFHRAEGNMRLQYLFLLGVTGQSPFLDDYLRLACQRVEERFHWKPAAVGLFARYGYTQAFSNADPSGKSLQTLEQEYKRLKCA